jgi:hypothetical protein
MSNLSKVTKMDKRGTQKRVFPPKHAAPQSAHGILRAFQSRMGVEDGPYIVRCIRQNIYYLILQRINKGISSLTFSLYYLIYIY